LAKASISNLYAPVARKVLDETIRLKSGETLTIETWTGGLPLARLIALEAKKRGAFPIVTYEDEGNYLEAVRSTPKDALGKMGKHEYGLLANSDAFVFIPGPPVSGYYPRISRKEFVDSTAYNGSWYEAAKKSKLRGARLTYGWVGNDLAKLLGKEKEEILQHQLRAALVDLKKIQSKSKSISNLLVDGAESRVSSEGYDLTFRLKGEMEIQDSVTGSEDVEEGNNMSYVPAGYVSKDIDTASVDGTVHFSSCVTRFGLLKDAIVRIRNGKFVDWRSKSSPDVLKALEEVIPEKGRVPSTVIVGLNPAMKFGYGQDRFPSGSITVLVGFSGIVRKGTLAVGGRAIVRNGRLL
jgi:leucyl aminopeptidase (aminopeptidase T)